MKIFFLTCLLIFSKVIAQPVTIPFGHLARGVYFIKVGSGKDVKFVKKIVK